MNTTASSPSPAIARMICIHCNLPTSTLYRAHSHPGSIQLTSCANCRNDVDPYVEREWLLVIMDCVLHRREAFRHLLYNRSPFRGMIYDDATSVVANAVAATTTKTTTTTTRSRATMSGDGGEVGRRRRPERVDHRDDGNSVTLGDDDDTTATKGEDGDKNRRSSSDADVDDDRHSQSSSSSFSFSSKYARYVRYAIASSLLRTFLRCAANDDGGINDYDDNGDRHRYDTDDGCGPIGCGGCLVSSFLRAVLGEAILISCVVFTGSIVVGTVEWRSSSSSTSTTDIDDDPFFYHTRLYLASTLPVYFHLVTMFASIWENSYTVRLLGTIYVLSLQRVAVSVVVEEERIWRTRRRCGRSRSRRNDEYHGNENEEDHRPDDDDGERRTNDDREHRHHNIVGSRRRNSTWGDNIRLPNSFPLLVGLIARAIFVRGNASLLLGPSTYATMPIVGDGRDDLVVASCAGVAFPRTSFFGVTMDSFCIE